MWDMRTPLPKHHRTSITIEGCSNICSLFFTPVSSCVAWTAATTETCTTTNMQMKTLGRLQKGRPGFRWEAQETYRKRSRHDAAGVRWRPK